MIKQIPNQIDVPVFPREGGGNMSSTSNIQYGRQPIIRNGLRRPYFELKRTTISNEPARIEKSTQNLQDT